MIKTVLNWPDLAKRYADVAFAIFPEILLSLGHMWLDYDDTLTPEKALKARIL